MISIPTSFVSLFIFYILSYLLSKTMGCLSGCLMSSASIQKLFCRICSDFKCPFNEFGGESGLPVLFLCHLRTTSEVFTIINCTMRNNLAHYIFANLFDFFSFGTNIHSTNSVGECLFICVLANISYYILIFIS